MIINIMALSLEGVRWVHWSCERSGAGQATELAQSARAPPPPSHIYSMKRANILIDTDSTQQVPSKRYDDTCVLAPPPRPSPRIDADEPYDMDLEYIEDVPTRRAAREARVERRRVALEILVLVLTQPGHAFPFELCSKLYLVNKYHKSLVDTHAALHVNLVVQKYAAPGDDALLSPLQRLWRIGCHLEDRVRRTLNNQWGHVRVYFEPLEDMVTMPAEGKVSMVLPDPMPTNDRYAYPFYQMLFCEHPFALIACETGRGTVFHSFHGMWTYSITYGVTVVVSDDAV
jgi:hypothetical protein